MFDEINHIIGIGIVIASVGGLITYVVCALMDDQIEDSE